MELGLLAFGFFLSIWLFNVVLVPVLYGVPKSLVWAVRGWVRWRVPALYLIAPVVWLLVFFGGAVVVAVLFPGGMLRLRESGGFGMGQALGCCFQSEGRCSRHPLEGI